MAYGAVGPSFAVGDPRPRELAFGWSPRDYWSSVCFMLLISSPCTLSPPPPVQPDSGPPALLNCAKDSVPHRSGRVPAGPRMRTRTHFTHRVDRWDSAGENIIEHLACASP